MQIQQAVVDVLTRSFSTRLNQTPNDKPALTRDLFAPDKEKGQHWKTLYRCNDYDGDRLSATKLALQEASRF